MKETNKQIIYLSHGNELVISKIHVLIDSLIKYQNEQLLENDMLFEALKARFIRFRGQLCYNDYIVVFGKIHHSKCLSIREYVSGITVECSCRKQGEEPTNSIDVLIWIISEFMDVSGLTARPVWGLLEIFGDQEEKDIMKVSRNIIRAYRHSTSPVCYIEQGNRLLPIYSVEHANQIADTYTRYEKTHCQSHVEELLDGLCLY